jgi:hypothetical protein
MMFCCVKPVQDSSALPPVAAPLSAWHVGNLESENPIAVAIRRDDIEGFKRLTNPFSIERIATMRIVKYPPHITEHYPIFYYSCRFPPENLPHLGCNRIINHLIDLFGKNHKEQFVRGPTYRPDANQTALPPLLRLVDNDLRIGVIWRLLPHLSLQNLTSGNPPPQKRATRKGAIKIASLLNTHVNTLMFSIGLIQAQTAKEPTPLQRFQRSSLYEPKVLQIVRQFLRDPAST